MSTPLPPGFPIETQDLVVLVAKVIESVSEAKEDDGKVSMPESAMMVATLTPDIVRAVKGISLVPRELSTLGYTELDALYFDFLTRIKWAPSDVNKAYFEIAYDVASAIIVGGIRWKNTKYPPKAEIVQ